MSATDGVSRRRVLGGSAAVGVAGPLLAACGSDDGGEATEPAEKGTVIAQVSEVPVGGGVVVSDSGVVVTQPQEGTFRAFSSTSTHQGCQMASVSETINCSCHGSKFSISDGSVQNGPATSDLPERTVTVDGGQIKAG